MKILRDDSVKNPFSLPNNCYLITFCITSLLLIIFYYNMLPNQPDSEWYIELAKGNLSNVHKPFSTRILYPLIVGKFAAIFNLSLNNSFFIINTLSLILFITTITITLELATSYSIIAFPLLFSPFLLFLFSHFILPELFYASLLALFFVCIITDKYYYSLILLFLLCLIRENTFILSLCIIVISFWKSQKTFALVTMAVTILGLIVTYMVALQGGPNIHNLNPFFYMVLKIPANFLSNVMGLRLWTDTLALNPITAESFSNSPFISFMLPKWLQLGGIHKIGILPFSIEPPITTIESLLTIFGVVPSLLFLDLKYHYKEITINNNSLLIMLTYGIFSFIIGTSSGADVFRLISYGWPAFILAAPILIYNHYSFNVKSIALLCSYQLIACWVPWIFIRLTYNYLLCNSLIIGCALVVHYLAIKELQKARNRVKS